MTRGLPEVLAALNAPRLLVVGDLVLDRYLTGTVDRISPEAPIQVLRVESETERLGGAGSVAQNVAVLGADTVLLGLAGEDAAAKRLRALALQAGVRLELIVDASRRTSVKTRHLARSHSTDQQVLRVDEETVAVVSGATEDALCERLEALLPDADGVLVSDYGKGTLSPAVLALVTGRPSARGIPVVVDPKGDEFDRYRGATCITPNRPECLGATGVHVKDPASAEAAATALIDSCGLAFALITLDREGMYLKEDGRPGVHLPTTPREVFDVTGAGDMVVSVLGMALASGASPREAAELANVAAGLEVEHVGVVPVTREEISARLASSGSGAAAKQVDRAEVGALAARLRAGRQRIVFTNGCFDLLHAGHVRYLAEAKAHGDVLIVGLNSDESVRRLKGAARPLNALADRIDMLAALAVVDHVVVFDEDVPTPLIQTIRPDVLVKGMDWKDKGVAGREFVEAHGGKVVLVELYEGRSTSALMERVRESGRAP